MYVADGSFSEQTGTESVWVARFEDHIRSKTFPCVGAKSALAQHQMQFLVVGDIRCPRDDRVIYETLRDFARSFAAAPKVFQSLVVIFNTETVLTEEAFEAVMWRRLQALDAIDAASGHAYDPRVSPDTGSPEFSLSFAGEAFFAVGMHPGASRPARRFDMPALVFNAHQQFETLRADGRYEHIRETVIRRDIALTGYANPMLARHGEISEARQYSGRAVDEAWSCPMQRMHGERV